MREPAQAHEPGVPEVEDVEVHEGYSILPCEGQDARRKEGRPSRAGRPDEEDVPLPRKVMRVDFLRPLLRDIQDPDADQRVRPFRIPFSCLFLRDDLFRERRQPGLFDRLHAERGVRPRDVSFHGGKLRLREAVRCLLFVIGVQRPLLPEAVDQVYGVVLYLPAVLYFIRGLAEG